MDCLASKSASSLPRRPTCDGIHTITMVIPWARDCWHKLNTGLYRWFICTWFELHNAPTVLIRSQWILLPQLFHLVWPWSYCQANLGLVKVGYRYFGFDILVCNYAMNPAKLQPMNYGISFVWDMHAAFAFRFASFQGAIPHTRFVVWLSVTIEAVTFVNNFIYYTGLSKLNGVLRIMQTISSLGKNTSSINASHTIILSRNNFQKENIYFETVP